MRAELHTDMWVGWLIKNNDLKWNAIMSRNTFPYRNMPRMAERIHMPPSLVRHRVPLQRQIQQTGSYWGLEEYLKDTETNLNAVNHSGSTGGDANQTKCYVLSVL